MSAQLVVTYLDHTVMYYPVADGWRVDAPSRCVVIGRMPRTYIPLDTVRSFWVEKRPSMTAGHASNKPGCEVAR